MRLQRGLQRGGHAPAAARCLLLLPLRLLGRRSGIARLTCVGGAAEQGHHGTVRGLQPRPRRRQLVSRVAAIAEQRHRGMVRRPQPRLRRRQLLTRLRQHGTLQPRGLVGLSSLNGRRLQRVLVALCSLGGLISGSLQRGLVALGVGCAASPLLRQRTLQQAAAWRWRIALLLGALLEMRQSLD